MPRILPGHVEVVLRPRRRTYLRSAPGKAHLGGLARLGGERRKTRGHGVLCPSRGAEVTDLHISIRTSSTRRHAVGCRRRLTF